MNTPRDHDAVIEAWLDDGPVTLPADTRQAIRVGIRSISPRHQGIGQAFARLGLPTVGLRRHWVALGALALGLLGVVGVMALYVPRLVPNSPAAFLPATPGAWERIEIDTPSGTGGVYSIAANAHGLLAVVGEADRDGRARLVSSTDGLSWTLVPEQEHPMLSDPRSFGYPSVVGTERGFLLLQLGEVWLSENGYDWRSLAGPATDADLRLGGPGAVTAVGTGFVGVGGDKAWYSEDGSDWALATLPELPEEILARPDSERYVEMRGVTAAGDDLVAWGIAAVEMANNSDEHLVTPLLWASHAGRAWSSVALPEMDSITSVTGGPRGFVAVGVAGSRVAAWVSADGAAWERVADGSFTSRRSAGSGDMLKLEAVASTRTGYIAVGRDGPCSIDPCPDEDAVIWTSADGRTWFAVASDERFMRASATEAVPWGSRFVVGGFHDGKPAIWISDTVQSGSGASVGTDPAPMVSPSPGTP